MVIYEVNLEISREVFSSYCTWLEKHVEEIAQLPGFFGADIFRDNDAANKLVVFYRLQSMADYDNYMTKHAPKMREDALQRFPNQFKATRRVLQVLGNDTNIH